MSSFSANRLLGIALSFGALTVSGAVATVGWSQEQPKTKPSYPPIQTVRHDVGALRVDLRRDTGTVARLSPAGEANFDFTPSGREAERQGDGYVHLGDINIRLRTPGGEWQDFASSRARRPIRALPVARGEFAAADITASLGNIPLSVERRWANVGSALVMRFTLTNRGTAPVEVGGLGMPMVFDNILIDRNLETAHTQASFVDPYIGRDAGYLQVTRLNGKGSALLVLPEKGTPLEAYRPILQDSWAPKGDVFTDKSPRGQVSEGFYDWTVASKGFAEKEWKNAGEQWNTPTSFTLAPGASRTVGVRFVQSPSIRKIEDTLAAQGRPVAVGFPGYVVPTDQPANLFLKSPQAVRSIDVFPANALQVTPAGSVKDWRRYTVSGSSFGRARVSITYADGSVQTVSYFVTRPLDQTMAALGRFSTTKQFLDDPADPFKRAPAILTYDRDADKIVTQEPRVWIAGMSDEGGGGAWVAAIMKQLDNPVAEEVAKLERVVNETVVGKLQIADGPQAGAVRKSLFFYEPKDFPDYYDPKTNWKSWTSWDRKHSEDLGRAYNYPHVAIGHWVLYRLARNHVGLVKTQSWRWYLDHAYQTVVAMMRDAPYYTRFGLMEGDVFVDILKDLKREGMTAEATTMEALMKSRADLWKTEAYPFGSEMPWDSTGQAEVYAWMRYFGHQPQADMTREVILAYDPTVPNWGYNGNARRYWDFLYGGKVPRIERQIHHYGSTLNAVPLFDAFRRNPDDLHLLRVAYGGMMGGITNIDENGFSSAAFHSAPDMMTWDSYTGDYGMGFYGHALTAATYVVKHPTFGWLGFGGPLSESAGSVTVTPRDGARTRLFVAPAGAWITLEAGRIASATYTPATGRIALTLDPATVTTPQARVSVEQTRSTGRPYAIDTGRAERGAHVVRLGATPTTVVLTPR
ncbi:hypothetical protein JW805_01740 [Roseomonas aeriglobus]|nr:hypothetical protein [Roseomonas aeriglobus]